MRNFRKLLWIAFIAAVTIALVVIVLVLHRPPPDIVADFAGRTGGMPIAPNFLGTVAVGSTLSDPNGIRMITDSNLRGNRVWAALDLIYAKSDTPDFALIDQQLDRATQDGLDPIVALSGTPPSMGSWCTLPTGANVEKWADMAVAVAAHFELTHKHLRYEIWNEPDSAVSNCTSTDPLTDYINLYAVAAPKVRAAVPSGKVGGPALAAPANDTATWIPRLLSDTRTAPYVEFISWHVYVTGQWDIDHGMDWPDLYNITIDPARGIGFYYRQLEALVRKGSQPDAAHTPIYLTEYNTNWAFAQSCCQNHPVYGPLWNAIALEELMNAGNDGAASISTGLMYYSAANGNQHFCFVGAAGTDCKYPTAGQPFSEFPSLLTYQMFAMTDKLDVEDGGNVVAKPVAPAELKTVAFYTPNADNVVVINPTEHDYPEVRVKLSNLGLHSLDAESFTIAENHLIRTPLSLRARVDGVQATMELPPYATIALRISGGH